MSLPSTDIKDPKPKAHWSIYVHWGSVPFVIVSTYFLLVAIAFDLSDLQSFTRFMFAVLSWGIFLLTKPIKIPDDTIENQKSYLETALNRRDTNIFLIKYCLVVWLVTFTASFFI